MPATDNASSTAAPTISVVFAGCARPDLLDRSLDALLRQNHDPHTVEVLEQLDGVDERFHEQHDIDACSPLADTEREAARQRLGIAPACFVVLNVLLHTVTPRDGIDTVILGLARLRQRYGVDGMLLVAGGVAAHADNAELARLRDLARALCVESQVHFVCDPPPDALRDCQAAADVLVSTPWCASRDSAAREAMACALPVIRTDVGGPHGTICDAITGYLIPPRDAELLADRLARLQRLLLMAQAMGEAGRAHLSNPDHFEKKATS